MRLAPHRVEHLDQRRQIGGVRPDLEDRLAAIAVERLDHDFLMLGEEGARFVEAARDERRRHELRIIEHEHFLRRVAHRRRVVDHQRLVRDPLEQMRRGDIAEVERRILPHQHDIGFVAEVEADRVAEAVMIADDTLDGDGIGLGPDPAVRIIEIFGAVVEQPVPAFLRSEHQREGRIAGDVDMRDRVHLDGDCQAHRYSPSG